MRPLSKGALSAIAAASYERPGRTLALVAVSVALALGAARTLRVNGDLVSLLPATAPSVQGLSAYQAKGGTVGYVALLLEGGAPEDRLAHAHRLRPALEALDTVAYVEARRPAAFFEARGLYYLSLEDVEDLADRVAAQARRARRRANPLLVDLSEEPAPPLELEALARRLPRGLADRPQGPHYTDDDAQALLVLVKPAGRASDLGFARRVVAGVSGALASHPPADPAVRVSLGGRFPKRVAQQAMLQSDLRLTSLVALGLVLGYLALYFRRLRDVVVVLAPLGVGLAWTFGVTALAIGELNVLTAFVGAILIGLGIDHGLHLMTRYDAARARGSAEEALAIAFGDGGRAVLLAGLTTALGFAGLAATAFRAFREFGLVAAAGGLLVLAAYLVVLPALLRMRGAPAAGRVERTAETSHLAAHPVPALLLSTAGLVALAVLAPRLDFDDDFAHLDPSDEGAFALDARIDAILGRQQASVAIVAEDLDDAAQAALTLRRQLGPTGIDFVVTARDLVPSDQEAKQDLLREMADDIERLDPGDLPPEQRAAFERLRGMVARPPFSLADLPTSLRHELVLDGPGGGGLVLVYPSVKMSDGDAVLALAESLSHVELPSGDVLSATGEAMVLADVLRLVYRETPRAVAITVGLVALCLWVLLGRVRLALLAFVPAVLTVAAALGAARAVGLSLDFLNVVFVPVLFGLAVDAGVHFAHRRPSAAGPHLRELSRAILGAHVTTACGFGALLLARHPGLQSLGRLALLGLGTSAVVALVWLPALWLSRGPGPRDPRDGRLTPPPVQAI